MLSSFFIQNFKNQNLSYIDRKANKLHTKYFINILCAIFLYERLFSSYVLALNELSYEKRAQKNVDDIEPQCQFHRHFMRPFFVRRTFWAPKF